MARCLKHFVNSVGGVVDLFCWCVCFFVMVCLIIQFSVVDPRVWAQIVLFLFTMVRLELSQSCWREE